MRSPIFRSICGFTPLSMAEITFTPFTSLTLLKAASICASEIFWFRDSSARSFSFSSAITLVQRSASSETLPSFRACAACCISSCAASSRRRTPVPVTASIRRTPDATEFSETMRNKPSFAVLSTCVPPQNSTEKSETLTTRTTSPYFSPKSAIAPRFLASAIGRDSVVTGMAARIFSLTSCSTFWISSLVIAEKCEKSNRQYCGVTS